MKNHNFWLQNPSIFRLPKGIPPTSAWVISGWPRMAARCSAVCPVAERSSMSARSASSAKTEAFRDSRRLWDGDWPGETIKSDCSYQWWKQFCNQAWRFFMEFSCYKWWFFSRYKWWFSGNLHSGKHTKNYGKSLLLMGKSTISMAIFTSYVSLPEGTSNGNKFGKLEEKNRERIETILKTCKTSRQLLEKDWSANSTLMNSEHFEIMLGNHWEQHWELQRRLWTIETTHFWIRYIESGKVERLRLHKWGKIRTWTSLLTKKRSN